jgi:hypothetical protein
MKSSSIYGSIVLGIFPLLLSAQAYLPLIESNKIWSCYGDYFFLNVKYQVWGDTLLNNRTYKKVWAHGSDVPYTFNQDSAQYKSSIFEENGKVWVVEKNFIAEYILYDFTKNVGDTIRFYRPTGNINQGVLPNYAIGKVYKKNTVTINGVPRRRLYIHDPFMIDQLPSQVLSQLDVQADVWIEGLGGKTGLFSRMPIWGIIGPQPYLLACVTHDGAQLYMENTGYPANANDPCFIIPPNGGNTGGGGTGGGPDTIITTLEQFDFNSIMVYPNPVQHEIKLGGKINLPTKLMLYNLDGVCVWHGETTRAETATFNINNLPAQLYFLEVKQGDRWKRMKILKE